MKTNEQVDKVVSQILKGMNVFVFIYMDGCGHCERMKPDWEKLKYSSKVPNWNDAVISSIESSHLTKDSRGIINDKSIVGFPTLRHYKNKEKEEYNKPDRSFQSLEEWIDSNHSQRHTTYKPKVKSNNSRWGKTETPRSAFKVGGRRTRCKRRVKRRVKRSRR